MSYLLLILLLIPLITSLILFFTSSKYSKYIAVAGTLVTLIYSIYLFTQFLFVSGYQLVLNISLSSQYGISFYLGIDGLSLPLVILTSIVLLIAVWYQKNTERENLYYGLLLFLEFGLMGVFISLDFFIFYIFWELVLIPGYFLVGRWGGKRKDYVSIKFLIYTHVGSLFMLLSIFTLYYYNGIQNYFTFSIPILLQNIGSLHIPILWSSFIVFGFMLAFLIKLPTVPLHTWAPDAYVEAPDSTSMIFSGVMSKMGAYGMFRFILSFAPIMNSTEYYILLGLGILSLLYASLSALAQKDLKRLVSYASIGHMSFITIAVAIGIMFTGPIRNLAVAGGMFYMFAHGIIIVILFGSVGAVERATKSRIIGDLGGLTKKMPYLAFIMTAGFLASLGLPGFAGFIAEFSIIIGVYPFIHYLILLILVGVVLVASYHLWALQRSIFGPYNETLGNIKDMTRYEFWPMLMALLIALFLGIYPTVLFKIITLFSGGA
ncbi:MAG: complex I subunit 4 family protein [Thermoplasmata archaeon]